MEKTARSAGARTVDDFSRREEAMTELLNNIETPSDAELISRVRGGDVAAYGDLFSRHVTAANRLARQLVRGPDADDLVAEAFAKVLSVLQGGGGPDVAFRAYLLTAVRRLHVDRVRAGSRLQTTDDMSPFDPGIPFQDTAVEGFESGAAAKAFASLPERWQLVLWHLEVEGQKPADIAPLLGMSANSVSALAYRAREGLRQAFLTMHLSDISETECRWVNEHLGAYVRHGLSKRDTTKVRTHLEGCRRCTAMYLELTEVNSNLSAIIAPLLLGAAATGYVASTGGLSAAGVVSTIAGRVRDVVLGNATAATAGAVAASVAAAAVVGITLTTGHTKQQTTTADKPLASGALATPKSFPAAPKTKSRTPLPAATTPATRPLVPGAPSFAAAPSVAPTPGAPATDTSVGYVPVPGGVPAPAAQGGGGPVGNGTAGGPPASKPGTTDPGTSNPGTNDPGPSNPGTGTGEPGTGNPGTNDPGPTNPGTGTGTGDPGTGPSNPGPGTGGNDPGTNPSGPGGDPGSTDPGSGINPPSDSSSALVDVSVGASAAGATVRLAASAGLPPFVVVRLESSNGGITFAKSVCSEPGATTARCIIPQGGAGSAFIRSNLSPGASPTSYEATLPFAIPADQRETVLTVSVTLPAGWDSTGSSSTSSEFHYQPAAPTADLELTLPTSTPEDSPAAQTYTLNGQLTGVPQDVHQVVLTLPESVASIAFTSTDECAGGGTTVTCDVSSTGPDDLVAVRPKVTYVGAEPVDITVTAQVSSGFVDPTPESPATAPTKLQPKSPESPTGLSATASLDSNGWLSVTISGAAADKALTLTLYDKNEHANALAFEPGTSGGCTASGSVAECVPGTSTALLRLHDPSGLLPGAVTVDDHVHAPARATFGEAPASSNGNSGQSSGPSTEQSLVASLRDLISLF